MPSSISASAADVDAPADAPSSHPRAAQQARLKRFLSYYRPHAPLLAADLGCAVLVSATALLLPLCANVVTRRIGGLGGASGTLSEILAMGGVMLALLGVQALATLFVDYQGHVMGAKMEARLRAELFEHCQKLSFSFYDRNRVGQLMSRITHDLFSLGELYHHGPEDLAIAVLKFTGAAAILVWLDPTLALIVLATMPLAALFALHFNGRMNLALRMSRRQIAAINERVEDALAGIRVIKSFTNEPLESRRFGEENARFLDIRRFGYRNEAYFSVGMDGFAQVVTLLVIVAGAVRVLQAGLDAAGLLTFLLCVAILLDPVKRLANFVRLWQEGYTGFIRFTELMELEPEARERPGACELERVRGGIEFRGVGFAYEAGREVLKDLSFQVAPGEFVALVGVSGVGKTTLCSLIPRFYEVTTGEIRIDGRDIREATLTSLRRNIGIVQQDLYLFAGTVAENLRYGRPDATPAEIVEAARRAHADEFITSLPKGYDTDVGQRGVKLSGGQKQRLTIARAFLKDPPILIFDEATSALDTESERAVQQALADLAKDRTTLVIAHRLSTVRGADRILVLTPDGIAEQGRHDQLIAAGGAYARLYRAQASI